MAKKHHGKGTEGTANILLFFCRQPSVKLSMLTKRGHVIYSDKLGDSDPQC